MSKRLIIPLAIFFFITMSNFVLAGEMKSGEFLVLCYHAVPARPSPDDRLSVPQNLFVEQMEYLRTHGYHPVSLDDIQKASEGKKELPQNPVLLTFDDAYISYYEFIVPVLEEFGYPSVLSVIGRFIDHPPEGLPEPLMSWDQIRNVAAKGLVEVVSHTYDLHKGIKYNPSGNVASAVAVRAFDPETKTYETEDEYRARIETDFKVQHSLFNRRLDITPRAITWPYGRDNAISMEVAREAGYRFGFTLEEGFAQLDRLYEINRNLVKNKPIQEFIEMVKNPVGEMPLTRAIQVDLDLIYDPDSYEQTDQNLGRLIDRLVAMKINTVYLQAFSDSDGTGDIKSTYFYNRVLPVKADIFSHAVHQMFIRDIKVYAWLPVLSIELPDRELNESLRVREIAGSTTRPSQSWYKRLTPFSSEVRDLVRTIYEDIAAHSLIQGVLFQDDAYLTDSEDFHPSAVSSYKGRFDKDFTTGDKDLELAMSWARYKTEVLIDFTKALMEGVRRYRPDALFARNLYATVLTDPESEKWFAQNYELFLRSYDQVVIMMYPQMEGIEQPSAWLEKIVGRVKEVPHGIEKTVFKVQAYDWQKKAWLNDGLLLEEMRDILASGGRHIAYYPDNFWLDRPQLKIIKLEMSTQTYPFMK